MLKSGKTSASFNTYIPYLIAIAVIALYSRVLWHEFVIYDDPAYVIENPHVRAGLTLDGIRWAFTSGYESNWFPLTRISHMIDVSLFGMNPAGHHFVNLLFHALGTALLYIFLNRTTGKQWLSIVAALLFGLHPLRVESVAWIAERKDVLSTFLCMLTLNIYSVYTETKGFRWYLATICLFALGLMSKPMLVTLPVLMLLMDWWPLNRWRGERNKREILPLWTEKLPFFILAASSSLVTYLVQQSAGTVAQTFTIPARLARASVSYLLYLYKTLYPVKLTVIYPVSIYPPGFFAVATSITVLALITLIAVYSRRKLPYFFTGWLWYLVSMMPVIGLIQVGQHSIADRYTYIPHIGIFITVVWGADRLMGHIRRKRELLLSASAIALIILIVLTSLQLRHWKNSVTLFRHALEVTDNNWVAHDNLGQVLLEQGKVDEAIAHFRASVKAKPSYTPGYINLGVSLHTSGKTGEAIESFRTASMQQPLNPKIHLDLGYLYLEQGNIEQASAEYRQLQNLSPSHAAKLYQMITSTGKPGVNR